MSNFDAERRRRFEALSTTNVSDAMDALGIRGATYGIRPMWHTMDRVLGPGAKLKGISGVVIDGACRDLDECVEVGFSVYARGTVVATARGRVQEEATNVMVQFGGVQVRPGDIIMGDKSGVVVVPAERVEEVLEKAESLFQKEEAMVAMIREGKTMTEMDDAFQYEKMLK